MLSLTRLARSRPGFGSVILPRATGRISGPRLQRLSRSYSDERPFDSGSLSVPIPFESRQKIELSGNRKAKPSRQAVSPTTTPIAPRSPSRAKKSQRQIGRERALARRQRNNQAKAKAKVGGKAKDVEHYAEKEGSEATKVKNEATSLEDRTASTKELGPKEIDEIVNNALDKPTEDPVVPSTAEELGSGRINANDVSITEVTPYREMKVARLAHGLHRALFSPGVIPFRDLRSGTWNFPPDFMKIPTPEEFAFDRTPQYVPPSQDEELTSLAKREECKFIGSTSTLTGAFSQIYFAISGGKGVDLSNFSQSFASERSGFTFGAELPAMLVLGPLGDGSYYVDSDKQYDSENILSRYGVILEKLLITNRSDFNRFLNSSPPESVSAEERNEKEAYRYSKFGSLMMRSQLDCQDDRLPGSGVFDVKTRACLPIRHDRGNYVANSQYAILKDKGAKLSFEKEYYDIVRSGMLKWSLQARIGGMDGIFVAYHNTKRLTGFQYLPMAEIDERIFGSSEMANQAFNLVVSLFEILIQHCADAFPGKELSIVIRRTPGPDSKTVVAYVSPTGEGTQPIQTITMDFTSYINGRRITRLLDNEQTEPQEWSVGYTVRKSSLDDHSQQISRNGRARQIKDVMGVSKISVPEGKTIEEMSATHPEGQWKNADRRILDLRAEAKKSGIAYGKLSKGWKDENVAWKMPTRG